MQLLKPESHRGHTDGSVGSWNGWASKSVHLRAEILHSLIGKPVPLNLTGLAFD